MEGSCGTVAGVVDLWRAVREEGLKHPQVVEVQDVVNSLASVATNEEWAQDVVVVGRQVGEYGGEDVVLGPEGFAMGGDDAKGHRTKVPVSVWGFWDSPCSDEGAGDPGDEQLVRFQKREEELVIRGFQ